MRFYKLKPNTIIELDDGQDYIHWLVWIKKYLDYDADTQTPWIKGPAIYLGKDPQTNKKKAWNTLKLYIWDDDKIKTIEKKPTKEKWEKIKFAYMIL